MKNTLKENLEKIQKETPKVRIREIAKQLNVSEAELVASGVGLNNTYLNNDFTGLLKEAGTLGYVMALTRNDFCVHERKGIYKKVTFNGHVGLIVTPDIDLRLFMNYWAFGFAVNENGRLSFQFFDKSGEAVHKIYLTDKSDENAYHQLIEKYKAAEQTQEIKTEADLTIPEEKSDTEIDVPAFKKAWTDLKDTHDFYGMLKLYGVSRLQAMRLAPEGLTERLSAGVLKKILEAVSEQSLQIMVFTGSKGCIQIHTGEIKYLVKTGPWFNVLDPEFNMHLREDGIASIWLVKKPTKDGVVTSIEVFDESGNVIVQFFGKRKPGIPESEDWRAIVNNNLEAVEL